MLAVRGVTWGTFPRTCLDSTSDALFSVRSAHACEAHVGAEGFIDRTAIRQASYEVLTGSQFSTR